MVKVPPDHPPEAGAVSPPCVRLNARSMHTPLVWTSLCMTSDATWDTKAYFGSGRPPPACDPMSNSPPARECGCRKLLFCPDTAQKTEGSRALNFRFRLRFSSRNRHRTKDGSFPRTCPLARSLNLPRVAQGRHERMTTPRAALAPQYNKSRERQLFRPSL